MYLLAITGLLRQVVLDSWISTQSPAGKTLCDPENDKSCSLCWFTTLRLVDLDLHQRTADSDPRATNQEDLSVNYDSPRVVMINNPINLSLWWRMINLTGSC